MQEFMFFILFAITTGSFMYILVCTDKHSKSPLGYMRRFMYNQGPKLIRLLVGQFIFNKLKYCQNFIFYQNHMLAQVLYYLVVWIGFGIYFYFGLLPHFGQNTQVSSIHIYTGTALFIYCNYCYYLACIKQAGIINKQNNQGYIKEFEQYYDGVLYTKNNECKTCQIIKPARSKHCRVCDVCVSKFDHHCIWIRQCVGQHNYKYFLKFIFVHALFCDYGAIVGIKCLHGIALQLNLYQVTFRNAITNEVYPNSFYNVARYIFIKETIFFFMVMVCLLFGISLTIFILYHLSMIRFDRTTNERVKRSEFKQLYLKEIKTLQCSLSFQKNKELEERLQKLKICWNSLNNQKYLGFYQGLKNVLNEKDA